MEELGFNHVDFTQKADYYVINTCTVTGKTDSRCRNAVRRARRLNPEAVIIATGCYAETQPEALRKMAEIDYVTGNGDKGRIPFLIEKIAGNKAGERVSVESVSHLGLDGMISRFHGHSRAFIKVQEGCDAYCSYCIIPYARGRSRSVNPNKVKAQVKRLAVNGYREIVLTGIHIGRYGENSGFSADLSDLIEMILDETDNIRLRLSSIEVTEITDRLIGLFASTDRIASHFHLPLQSGDDDILRSMNRPYSTSMFREKVIRISESVPRAALGTDIIVGFPGETDRNFENTVRFLNSKLPLNYFHVFSYSPRPGTKAYAFPQQVESEIKKKRSRTLIEIGKNKRREFAKSQVGEHSKGLVQGECEDLSGHFESVTGNYCEVLVETDDSMRGKLVPLKIESYKGGRLFGSIEGA